MSRIFISYSHKDQGREIIQELSRILDLGGYIPWFDDGLTPGDKWVDQLEREISASSAFIYAMTKASLTSEWCQWELRQAALLEKPILPVKLEEDITLPDELKSIQWVDFVEGATVESVARLMYGLRVAMTIPIEHLPPMVLAMTDAPLIIHRQKQPYDEESPPDFYDFKYLKREVCRRYGQHAGFLVIQYGSSVTDPINAGDEDYMVLIHGNFYHEDATKEDQGIHTRRHTGLGRTVALDIQFRLFDSFLIALIMGKPYELSVALKGEIINNHLMKKEYWGWLKSLSHNLMVDRRYLQDQLKRDMLAYRRAYTEAYTDTENTFRRIITAYHYVCDLIKINMLNNFRDHIPAPELYPLSQVKTLVQDLKTESAQQVFRKLVDYFKRNNVPSDWQSFDMEVNTLIHLIEQEKNP